MALLLVYPFKIPLLIYAALCIVAVGAVAGSVRGRPWVGGILSLILGPLGWFVVLLMNRADANPSAKDDAPTAKKPTPSAIRAPVSTTPCPACGRAIRDSALKRGANVCPWCGSSFECA